jgi:hypothetical protein
MWGVRKQQLRVLRDYGCGYFLKYFLFKKIKIIYFFILKKLFLTSVYQNNLKIVKKY